MPKLINYKKFCENSISKFIQELKSLHDKIISVDGGDFYDKQRLDFLNYMLERYDNKFNTNFIEIEGKKGIKKMLTLSSSSSNSDSSSSSSDDDNEVNQFNGVELSRLLQRLQLSKKKITPEEELSKSYPSSENKSESFFPSEKSRKWWHGEKLQITKELNYPPQLDLSPKMPATKPENKKEKIKPNRLAGLMSSSDDDKTKNEENILKASSGEKENNKVTKTELAESEKKIFDKFLKPKKTPKENKNSDASSNGGISTVNGIIQIPKINMNKFDKPIVVSKK